MKKYLIGCFLVVSSLASINAQSVLESWEGEYEGQMVVGFTGRANDSVDVRFELKPIEADSSWTYRMTYDSQKFGVVVKEYEIHRVGNSTVDFLLDEQDGIIIEMSLMNNCFYDMFEVMDNLYATTLRKIGDDIHFDLFTSAKKKATVTTSEEDDDGNIYEVTSYKPSLHQSIYLHSILRTKTYEIHHIHFRPTNIDELWVNQTRRSRNPCAGKLRNSQSEAVIY